MALPVRMTQGMGHPATLLGIFWTLFAVGEVTGGLATAYLRRWRLWPVVTGVIVGWGGCLLPLGATRSTSLALAGFAVGGLIYAPFPSITMTLFQRASPARDLTAVLAAQGSIIMLAPPLGAALGGPPPGARPASAVRPRRTLRRTAAPSGSARDG